MPFGLTNLTASFQEMTDAMVKDMEECIWYLNDILICGGDAEAEHQVIVEEVLQQCVDHRLKYNLLKSGLHVKGTILFGHVIKGQEVKMDSSKLKTISKWPILTTRKEAHAFLGFANYYRQFIVNYSAEASPLINLTKDVPFTCVHTHQQGFDGPQAQFPSTPIDTQFNRTLETIKETDASN